MRNIKRYVGGVVVLGSVCSAGVAQAATYYVSKAGSDISSCAQAQSTSTPRLSVKAGIRCLAAGDTLLVRGGTYDEGIGSFDEWIPSGTSWSNKVRIANYPGETVWLSPSSAATSAGGFGYVIWVDGNISYVEFDGINLDGRNLQGGANLWVSTNNGRNPHHIRFQNAEVIAGQIGGGAAIILGSPSLIGATGSNEIINVTIHGGGVFPGQCGVRQCHFYGIYIAGPNNLVENSDIYDTSGAGIHIYNGNGDRPDNNIIRNNRIHDITRTGSLEQVWGIIVTGANNQIYNNVIYGINVGSNNQGNAAIAVAGAENSAVNNTLYGNSGWGIVVAASTPGSIIRNNISYGNRLGNYADYGGGTFQSSNLFTDPRFVNPGAGDFRLRSDSPAIDRGDFLGMVQYDQAGVPRPQGGGYDIGAYEFGGAGGSLPVPTPGPSPAPGASPSGTEIPGAASIVDNSGAVWTLAGMAILRNGAQAAYGYGYKILWYEGSIYVVGEDYNWWRWVNNNWSFYASTPPN